MPMIKCTVDKFIFTSKTVETRHFRQKGEEVKLERVARLAGTIPYEIITGIAHRVPRRYV